MVLVIINIIQFNSSILGATMLLMTTLYQFTDCVKSHIMCCKLNTCKAEDKKKHCMKPLCSELGIQILKKSNFV